MGHGKRYKSLQDRANAVMREMLHNGKGTSKHADQLRLGGPDPDKIYSSKTYETYKPVVDKFVDWCQENHPKAETMNQSRKFVKEYMESLEAEKDYSAWTLSTYAAALHKIWRIAPDDKDRYEPPERRREDITRSRGEAVRDEDFREDLHADLVDFCRAAGPRSGALSRLTGDDLWTREEAEERLQEARQDGDRRQAAAIDLALRAYGEDCDAFVWYDHDKGGKCRLAPVIADEETLHMIEDKFEQAAQSGGPVWPEIPSHMDVHSCRADYATTIYEQYARDEDELRLTTKVELLSGDTRSEVIVCRRDRAGERFDTLAVERVSIALGHHRTDTAITNYIRK